MSTAVVPEPAEVTWENLIPPEHWGVYACVLNRACRERIPFALGGGLALGYYTGRLRRSKDLDIYIRPEDRDEVVQMMTRCGLEDYYSVSPYVREWIYRGHQDGVIVDAIWAMANQRARVDDHWLCAGPTIQLCGQTFRVIPAEELIWSKLYVLQRDRCDWPDIMNLLYATGHKLDWDHLLRRVGPDTPLVKAVLSVYSWVCPERASAVAGRVWDELGLEPPRNEASPVSGIPPKDLLDTRPWLLAEAPPVPAWANAA